MLYCLEQNTSIDALSLEELKSISDVFEEDIFDAISLDTCVNGRCVTGGPAKESALRQIETVRAALKQTSN